MGMEKFTGEWVQKGFDFQNENDLVSAPTVTELRDWLQKMIDAGLGHLFLETMDGKGAWRENVFVERLWRAVKYGEVYLHAYETVSMASVALKRYFRFYNSRRPHSGIDEKTPVQVFFKMSPLPMAA